MLKIKNILVVIASLFFLISCKNETEDTLTVSTYKQDKQLSYNKLNASWNFQERTLTPESQSIATSWNDWRLFTSELYRKPKGTIGAFKNKTNILVKHADTLSYTLPEKINKPQIKARLNTIVTKLKVLQVFMNLDYIPETRVVKTLQELNLEINAFQDQIEEIVRRTHIQLEEGEAKMIESVGGKVPNPAAPVTPPLEEEIIQFEEIK